MAFTIDNRITNSTENRQGRYVQGGLTDIISNNRLGWWEKRVLQRQEDDFRLVILKNEEARPDLISYRAYGKSGYSWLVLQYNNIVDPETELVTGAAIILPTQSRLILDIISQPVGGRSIRR